MLTSVREVSGADTDAAKRWGGRVPIVIGAAGHRDIDRSDARLIAALTGECRKLKKRYRHSPFVILSALAEGADRMIADIAMKELHADLIAVLPMPEEDYERDFGSEESKAEFRAFLDRAFCVKIAELPEGDLRWKVPGEQRNEQYARAGAIAVDHAHIFFAIWDGDPARGTGGTAGQVAWFDRGYSAKEFSPYKASLSPLAPFEPGLRIRIDPATAEVSVSETRPPEHRRSDIETILNRTDRYNRDAARAPLEKLSPLAAGAAEKVKDLSIIDRTYGGADWISAVYAGKVRGSASVVYLLALPAIAAFNLVSEFIIVPWIYFGITLAMALLASRVWLMSADNRFLEYRCLAEAMRTLYFWRNAGVTRPVWLNYLSRQSGVVHWIRHAVRSIEFCQDCRLPQQTGASDPADPAGLRVAKHYWVDNQKNWFLRKERSHYQHTKLWKRVENAAFALAFATAAILAVLTVLPSADGKLLWDKWVEPRNYGYLWQIALGLFAAGGLAARGFLAQRAHLELTKQYASQRQIFETASRMLDTIEHEPKPDWTAREILEKLGEEALQEQSEWVWLRHTRPFEVPTP